MNVRLTSIGLSNDMKNYIDDICTRFQQQRSGQQDYRQLIRDIATRFIPNNPSAVAKMEKAIADYMAEQGYVSKNILKFGFIDDNGIEVVNPNEDIPKELKEFKYGVHISNPETLTESLVDDLLDSGLFLQVSAYKLRDYGVLYPNKDQFWASTEADCDELASDIVEAYPNVKVGKTFNVVWSTYYDISYASYDKFNDLIKYNRTTAGKG